MINDFLKLFKYTKLIKYKPKNFRCYKYKINKKPYIEPIIENGFSNKNDDIDGLNYIAKKFGGTIRGLKENNANMNADYYFRYGKLELKTFYYPKLNTIDKKIQKGLKQIEDCPYGLLLDIRKTIQPYGIIKKVVEKRVDQDNKNFDVIIIFRNRCNYRIYMYKKNK